MDRAHSEPTETSGDQARAIQAIRHDLRTPVNHIVGYSEMLIEEAADGEETERSVALREVVAAGRAMLAQINDWLATLNPDAPDFPALQRRLAPLIAAVAHTCERLAHEAHAAGDESVTADLRTILAAATHLGAVAAGTATGGGEATGASPTAPPERALATPRDATILLVDDNALNRDMLARRLDRLGYAVIPAFDGREALTLLRTHPIDLVLLDLLMPELDGFGVLQELKADPRLRHVPVIVLSALDEIESVVRAIELGADDYMPRPFDPVLLRARIGACLFKRRMREVEGDFLRRIEEERRRADDLLHRIIPLGVALAVEKDFDQLLERIVVEAQELCRADGGTLYLRTEDQKLRFVIVRNRSLNIAMGGASGKDIPFPPLRLYDEASGAPLFNYVVTHAALEGTTINIADAYHAEGYDFSGTRDFDARTGYRTTSLLNVPLKDGLDRVIGVLQLLNAQDEHGNVVPFDAVAAQMLESLGALAANALSAYAREQQLRQEIADLRIEIDEQKRQREVAEITGSAYFGELQERARALRKGLPDPASRGVGEEARGPERREFVVNGQRIVARVQGPDRGRLLLLIHGWSSSWYALSPLLPYLSDRFRCVAVDLPGYGESPPLAERASIPAYADLLAGLIRQLSPGLPAVLVGHSMGGMTSVTLALRHPALVERMVLLCPTISGKLSAWINWFISPITMLERWRLAGGIVARLEPYMLSVTDRLMRPASFAERSGITEADYHRLRADARRPGQGRVRAECFWAMRANDLRGKLSSLSVPALVIWGMEDNTVPLRDASIISDEWPAVSLQVLPKAGHWPQFETPKATRKYVRNFLGTPIKLLKAAQQP